MPLFTVDPCRIRVLVGLYELKVVRHFDSNTVEVATCYFYMCSVA
jgi:hypothetical protein